jgi:archaellum biogenesis ATPase FlaH
MKITTYNQLQDSAKDVKFIPLNDKKQPLAKGWQTSTEQFVLSGHSVGLVCGKLSQNVEAIDFDLKYDLTGDLIHRYNRAVIEQSKPLLKKLTIQRTKSGGYHYVYRCTKIEGNQKLAQRNGNTEELKNGEKVKVLIETRGEGGQIAVYPSPGYEMIQGSWLNILTITEEERDILIETARTFNEYMEEVKTYTKVEKIKVAGITPWEDYDNRGDVIGLLQSHGWSIVDERGPKVNLLRPGSSTSKYSGNYHRDLNLFSVFTTSSVFEPNRGYKPSAVYAILECNGDFQESARKLSKEGYGEKDTTKTLTTQEIKQQSIVQPTVKIEEGERKYLVKRADYFNRIIQWRDGKYEMGKDTGYENIDKHFRFKEGNLVVINGFDNVGKSVMIWYLALLSSIRHNWKWLIYTAENDEFSFFRKMIELYWCMEIQGMPNEMIEEALTFLEKHFTVIKSDKDLYNYKDILAITENELKYEKFHALLIDPYNALDITINPKAGLNTHEYHYKAISEIKLFTKLHKLSIYINMHVVSSAGRGFGKGEIPAPGKSDTEGGNKFANKADEFITIHRNVGNPEKYNITELHIRKVKETETGGQVTPFENPIQLRSRRGVVGFEDLDGYSFIAYLRGKENLPESLKKGMKTLEEVLNTPIRPYQSESLDLEEEDNIPDVDPFSL